MEKEEFLQKRIRELADLSDRRDCCTFSDFLNLHEQDLALCQKLPLSPVRFGGYEGAERCLFAFVPPGQIPDWPIDCLRIAPRSKKFSESLTHRDYLGALLSLGLDRSVTGDILTGDLEAFLFCLRHVSDFIKENLSSVKHTSVSVERILEPSEIPSPLIEPLSDTVSSVRLDSLIRSAFKESRSQMVHLIEAGQVFVNGRCVPSNGYEPKEGDIISVRHKGRFVYYGTEGCSKKGRLRIRLGLYR